MPIIVGSAMRQIVFEGTVSPEAVLAATAPNFSFTVPQSVPGQVFLIQLPALEAGLIPSGVGQCSTAGTVLCRVANVTAATITPAAAQAFTCVAV